jgi:hypothetical protein
MNNNKKAMVLGLLASALFCLQPSATRAAPAAPAALLQPLEDSVSFVETVARRGRGGARVNRSVNRNVHRSVNRNVNRNVNRTVNRNVNRNVRVRTAWVRPGSYWWRPGAAVAAGAAIGFVAAATAVAWAGPAPAANYCWYYTDSTRTKGFWDVCP